MNEFVLPGLVRRRAELAGELEASRARTQQLHADLAALDAVIRQFDPAYPVDAIQAKRPRAVAVDAFAGMGRVVLDVLRLAGGPLTIAAVAERVVALRALDAGSGAVRSAIEASVGRALRHKRPSGRCGTPRRPAGPSCGRWRGERGGGRASRVEQAEPGHDHRLDLRVREHVHPGHDVDPEAALHRVGGPPVATEPKVRFSPRRPPGPGHAVGAARLGRLRRAGRRRSGRAC